MIRRWPVADAVGTLIHFKLVAKEYAMTPMGFCIESNQWMEVLKNLQERKNKVQEGLNELVNVDRMVRDNFDYFTSHPVQLSWLRASGRTVQNKIRGVAERYSIYSQRKIY